LEATDCCCSDGRETGVDGYWFGAVVSSAEGSGAEGPGDGEDSGGGGTLAVVKEGRFTCGAE
jgi:hypothetical protein